MAMYPCLFGGGGGFIPTLITKSITENGTYNAQDDNADGYSQVTVSVSGGGGSGRNTFMPQYTETKILDNSSGSTGIVTFDEDWHNYPMLRIVAYNTSYSRYFSFLAIPEGIDAAFTYSQNFFNINEVLTANSSPSTNQYCTYKQNSTLEWQRTNTRNMYIYEVYGITFTNCTLQKTEIYNRQGIGSASVTPTPPTGKTFFDYDVLIYMACSGDRTETQFGPLLLNTPKIYFQTYSNYERFFKYNANYSFDFTPTSIGTQLYFYVAGLKFVAT